MRLVELDRTVTLIWHKLRELLDNAPECKRSGTGGEGPIQARDWVEAGEPAHITNMK